MLFANHAHGLSSASSEKLCNKLAKITRGGWQVEEMNSSACDEVHESVDLTGSIFAEGLSRERVNHPRRVAIVRCNLAEWR